MIGGRAGKTILTLLSQDEAGQTIDAEKIPDLDKKLQDAGTAVVDAKDGKGSATLSMAYAESLAATTGGGEAATHTRKINTLLRIWGS